MEGPQPAEIATRVKHIRRDFIKTPVKVTLRLEKQAL
jgi:hypothetical protein